MLYSREGSGSETTVADLILIRRDIVQYYTYLHAHSYTLRQRQTLQTVHRHRPPRRRRRHHNICRRLQVE